MIDTIGTEKHNISLQINYTKNYRYYLNKIENYWYIYDYEKIDNQESNNTNSTLEKTTHN